MRRMAHEFKPHQTKQMNQQQTPDNEVAATTNFCRDLERELTKMTKERNDALQAYIVLDASYKMLRQELANLRNALALGGPLNKKQQEYINLHETIL
jgi:hypothetical protein